MVFIVVYYILYSVALNPKVDSPPFAGTVAAAAPLQLYQKDLVHQPLGLILKFKRIFLKTQQNMTIMLQWLMFVTHNKISRWTI